MDCVMSQLIIACSDGRVTCSRLQMEKHSILIREALVDECQCNAGVILPDIGVDSVRLAVSLLDEGVGDVKTAGDILETVTPVFTLLRILHTVPDSPDHGVLDAETGHFEVSAEVGQCYKVGY